ncbi:MAG: glycerate kinase [Clostridia bacterium]|nr:glycerate kinase [Clostridia bacterium]
MKIIIAPDSFKGSLSAVQVCDIIGARLSETFPGAEIVKIPIADGGEGTLDCFAEIVNGERIACEVTGPNFRKVAAEYLLCGDLAVIESAQANGLPLANPKSAKDTTTYGVGELIAHASDNGAQKFIIGIGGSATNDGGCGMAAALGTRFLDKNGKEFVPVGASLCDIAEIEFGEKYDITVLCDVTNPLCGENGAAYVYARQKGATDDEIKMLDSGLKHLSNVLGRYGINISDMRGAGAAGGMGAGFSAFTGAELKRGIDTVLDLINFDSLAESADFIITGEGALDSQSFSGKVIDGIISRSHSAPVLAAVGISKIENPSDYGLTAVFESNENHLPFEQVLPRAQEDLAACAGKLAQFIKSF